MEFIDPNIARKNKLQNIHLKKTDKLPNGSPQFSHVEFSICGLCNRKCVFCPRADPKVYPNVNEYMSIELYHKILNELKEINYEGSLSYSGFCEPLLHKKVVDFIALSRKILPNSRLEIITNGDNLTPDLIRSLFNAGLSTLLISMYDGPEQIQHFEEMTKQAKVNMEKVILRKRYLSKEERFGINLSNRGGLVNIEELNVKSLSTPMKNACYYAHYRMMVDHKGDVLLCPHDWEKKVILGNLESENIIDVWVGKKMEAVRRCLGKGDRSFEPCNVCDVFGTRQGGEHFKMWEEFYSPQEVINGS